MSKRPQALPIVDVPAPASRRRLGGAEELSYQCLFDAATEPMLVVDGATASIVEANRAAAGLLGGRREELIGRCVLDLFDASTRSSLEQSMSQARASGTAIASHLRARQRATEIVATFSDVQLTPGVSALLVRLAPALASVDAMRAPSAVLEAIESARTGFVVTDEHWRVQYTNAAFVTMVGLQSALDLEAEPLSRWLQLSEADYEQFRLQLRERRVVSQLVTRLHCGVDRSRQVEVSAVVATGTQPPCWGFTFREIQSHGALN